MTRFINPLPFVADMERAKCFYRDIMKLEIVEDHGDFVKFENGFALHLGSSLLGTIFGYAEEQTQPFGQQNLVLYFEDDALDLAFNRIEPHVEIIHPIQEQAWGQNVFRFFDPDRHIIEIGEPQSG